MATGAQLRAAQGALDALETFRLECRLYPEEHAQVQVVQDLILRERVAMIAENQQTQHILTEAARRKNASAESHSAEKEI